jgi:hypothetical protein
MSVPPNEPAPHTPEGWPDEPTQVRPDSDVPAGTPPTSGPPPPVTSPPPPPPGGYPAGGYGPADYPPAEYAPATQPFGQVPPAGVPAARRSRAVPILATLMVLFLLAALAMTGLFVVNKSSSDKKIADQKSQIQTINDDLAKANQERDAAKKKADSTDACIKAVQDFFKALNADDEVAGGKAALVIDRDCEGVDITFK